MKSFVRNLLLWIAVLLVTSCTKELTSYVNPFVGSDFHGHTYPGAIYPFGQIQPGPDTRLGGWDGCSGYHYSDDTLYGFSHTHLNGTGCEDLCDVLLMPITGEAPEKLTRETYLSTFSHANEKAEPGYYSVKMDNHIGVELTTGQRVAHHRYSFPKEGKKGFIIDLTHRDKLIDGGFVVRKVNNQLTILGWRESNSWNPDQHCYFAISTPLSPNKEVRFYDAEGNVIHTPERDSGSAVKIYVPLPEESTQVTLQVAISGKSMEGAEKNLQSDSRVFETVRQETHEEWERRLGKIEVKGGTKEEKRIFYTALYHCYTSPYLWSDVDDSNTYYTVFSLWDTYRALHPLMMLLEPQISEDWIKTMLMHFNTHGELTMWELHGHETHCMIGYHACPVILDAYQHHLLDSWPTQRLDSLLQAMVATSNRTPAHQTYGEQGYLDSQEDNESVSKTLEYAYDDWCIAQYARAIGNDSIYHIYIRRSQSWQNVMDSDGFMHARRNGAFVTPFNPTEVNNHFTEANSWQYSSYVPHDIAGWVEMLGGKEAAIALLDQLFSAPSKTSGRDQADITGMVGQYAHGNEPSHHAAYLYNYLGQPEKSDALVHRIMKEHYSSKPDGLCGNEDCGQMSAWYVLSALGFYPVCPGSGEYSTITPLFKKATLHLANGDITIERSNWPTGKIWRNGEFFDESSIALPVEERITPTPYFNDWQQRFDGNRTIELKNRIPGSKITYTIDGKEHPYTEPFVVDHDAEIVAVAYHPDRRPSQPVTQRLTQFVADKKLTYITQPEPQYYENGEDGLVDRLKGTENYRIGGWQGWNKDMVVVVDLLKERQIHSVGVECLEHIRSWIFFPRSVKVETSSDGGEYHLVGVTDNTLYPAIRERQEMSTIHTFTIHKATTARYLRITAQNYGAIPNWHISSGEQAWLFVDEIEIN